VQDLTRELSIDPFHATVDLFSFKQLVGLFLLCYLLMIAFFGLLFFLIAQVADALEEPHRGFLPDNSFWTCLQCAWQAFQPSPYLA